MKLKKTETGLPIKISSNKEKNGEQPDNKITCNFRYFDDNPKGVDLPPLCSLKVHISNEVKLCAEENCILMKILNLLDEKKQIESLIKYGPKPAGLC